VAGRSTRSLAITDDARSATVYKTIFVKTIWNGVDADASTKFALFSREERLPFVPTTTLEFCWSHGKPEAPLHV
jgi:hypothetical protein